jgi:ATP-dependent Lhr-like helicase
VHWPAFLQKALLPWITGASAHESLTRITFALLFAFVLKNVFDYLQPATARDVLIQALLPAPMFATRWRWNAQRSLLLDRSRAHLHVRQ